MDSRQIKLFSNVAKFKMITTMQEYDKMHKYPSGKFIKNEVLRAALKVIALNNDAGVKYFSSIFIHKGIVYGTRGDFFRAFNVVKGLTLRPSEQVEFISYSLARVELNIRKVLLDNVNHNTLVLKAQLIVIQETKVEALVVETLGSCIKEYYNG